MVLPNVSLSWPLYPLLPVIRGTVPRHQEGVLHAATTKPDGVTVYLLNLFDVSRETLEACDKIIYPSVERMEADGWRPD